MTTDAEKEEGLPWAMIAKAVIAVLFLIGSTLLATLYDGSIKDSATLQTQGEKINDLDSQAVDLWSKINRLLEENAKLRVVDAEKDTKMAQMETATEHRWVEFYRGEYEHLRDKHE